MAKLPPGFTEVVYDMGYAVMDNGDIVTSDGLPRIVSVDDLHTAMRLSGRGLKFQFRKPTPEEAEALRKQGIIL